VQVFLAIVDLLKGIAWPLAIFGSALLFKSDLRALFPRLRKAGPSGVEFDPVATQQRAASNAPAQAGQLRELPGFPRTKAIEAMERKFHAELAHIAEAGRTDLLVRLLAQSRLEANFGYIYGTIFGSQLKSLRRMEPSGAISESEAKEIFDTARAQFAQLDEYGFGGWMGFLLSQGLVIRKDSGFSLTDVGSDFLRYLSAMRLSDTARLL
jgi:hypothetical protein